MNSVTVIIDFTTIYSIINCYEIFTNCHVYFSVNRSSPRTELLHNIDPLRELVGQRLYPDSFDNRIQAAIRVGDMKLLTGCRGRSF